MPDPSKVDNSDEAIGERKKRLSERLDREKLQVYGQKAMMAYGILRRQGCVGVVAVERAASLYKFRRGLEILAGGAERILYLPANRTVQAEENDDEVAAAEVHTQLSQFRRRQGSNYERPAIVAFEGVDFSGQAGPGNHFVIERVEKFLYSRESRASGNPAILAMGTGTWQHIPGSKGSIYRDHSRFVKLFPIILGLDGDNQLHTARLEPSSLFNAMPGPRQSPSDVTPLPETDPPVLGSEASD